MWNICHRVDRRGRIVIPVPIREALGLKGGGKASVKLNGAKIVMKAMEMKAYSTLPHAFASTNDTGGTSPC